MKETGYRQAIIDYIRKNALPPEKFSHQPRLYALACCLAGDAPFDDDVVFAAAWLHDIGVFVGHRPEDLEALEKWDHVAYAFRVLPDLLAGFGFPVEKIPAVLEVIRTHLPATQPTCFEGTLVRDADLLEQLGAVGVLRTVSKVGRDTRFSTFRDATGSLRRALDRLPSLLELPAARAAAGAKVAILRQFLESAEMEAGDGGL